MITREMVRLATQLRLLMAPDLQAGTLALNFNDGLFASALITQSMRVAKTVDNPAVDRSQSSATPIPTR